MKPQESLNSSELIALFNEELMQDLEVTYPNLAHCTEQRKKLVAFLVQEAGVRQVVHIEQSFEAVEGHHDAEIAHKSHSIIVLPKGYYVTESKRIFGCISHTCMSSLSGKKYTVASGGHTVFTNGEFSGDGILRSSVKSVQNELHQVLLFKKDVLAYVSSKGKTMKRKALDLGVCAKDQEYDLSIFGLMEATGTSTEQDAYEMAIFNSLQWEEFKEMCQKSPFLEGTISALQKKQQGKLDEITGKEQMQEYLLYNHSFSSREKHVGAAVIFDLLEPAQ
jgi:hypothetical protein